MTKAPPTPPVSESDDPEYATNLRRATLASTVGSALEYYDFYIYGLASALIFGPLFFSPLGESGAALRRGRRLAGGRAARGGANLSLMRSTALRVLLGTTLAVGGSTRVLAGLLAPGDPPPLVVQQVEQSPHGHPFVDRVRARPIVRGPTQKTSELVTNPSMNRVASEMGSLVSPMRMASSMSECSRSTRRVEASIRSRMTA